MSSATLNSLTALMGGVVPEDWTTNGTQPEGLSQDAYNITWHKDGNSIGRLTLEIQPHAITILGFEVSEPGNHVFRNICRDFPAWARERDIPRFFVSAVTSQYVADFLAEAGWTQLPVHPDNPNDLGQWEVLSEEGNPAEQYGNLRPTE